MAWPILEYQLFSVFFFPFGIALVLSVLLLMVSRACRIVNIRPSAWLQHYLPDIYRYLKQRLSIDDIPAYQVLIVLLVNFGVTGYFLQLVCYVLSGHFVNPLLLLAPAFLLAHLLSGALIHWFKQLNIHTQLPENTSAEEGVNLLGRVATISNGNARPGASAEAMVRDRYGKLHIIQVEPEYGELSEHSEIILFARTDSHYLAKLLPPDHQAGNKKNISRQIPGFQ